MQALGFAALLLLANYQHLVFRGGNARLHSSASLTAIAGANLIGIAIVTSLVALLIFICRRLPRWSPVFELVLAVAIPPILLARNASLIDWPPHPYKLFLRVPGIESWQWPPSKARILVMTLVWLVFLIFLRMRVWTAYQRLLKVGGIALS